MNVQRPDYRGQFQNALLTASSRFSQALDAERENRLRDAREEREKKTFDVAIKGEMARTQEAERIAAEGQEIAGAKKDLKTIQAVPDTIRNPDKEYELMDKALGKEPGYFKRKSALSGAIESDPELSGTEKAFYNYKPEAYGDRLKPAPMTYLPGEGGYVAVPTRGQGKATPVTTEAGSVVRPQPRPSEKTPEEVEAIAAAKARGAASVVKPLSAEDMQAVSMKLNSLKTARQQLQKVKDAANVAKASMMSGKGRGWIPTKENAAFEKAVAALKPTITSMTRVPGVGAMSDFETRLAMAPFPEPGEYGEVNDQAIQALEDLINQTESGYLKLRPQQQGASSTSGAANGPKVGDTKTNNIGMTVRWNGQRWEPAQ